MAKPLSPPPLDEAGAITQPRQLERWLDNNPVTQLTRTQAFVTLPSFSVSAAWLGYSDIVAVFNFASPKNLSFKHVRVNSLATPPTNTGNGGTGITISGSGGAIGQG